MKNSRHPFKSYSIRKVNDDAANAAKDKLREEVKDATEVYLKAGKKIKKIMDGPTVKVPSVGMKNLGNELSFGIGELYESPDVYTEMEMRLNKQLMEGDL